MKIDMPLNKKLKIYNVLILTALFNILILMAHSFSYYHKTIVLGVVHPPGVLANILDCNIPVSEFKPSTRMALALNNP